MSRAGKPLQVTDLAQPQLSPFQRDALAYGETLKINFTEESVLSKAREITGLEDFGDDNYRPRLALLLDEWGNDEGLTGLGRLSLHNKLVQHASSRLLIEDTLNRHPEIHDIEISRPIIVAGLPRSGTTHLLNLMAADHRFRSLPLWESYEPLPRPGEDALEDGTDPRWQRCQDSWEMMQAGSPLIATMHPMNPDHIHEELELMGPNFASYNYEWLSVSPNWRDHYYREDQAPHYQYMKTVLKILQWRRGPERWVLKCPQHLEQLPVLRKIFPDATVAITHRDPVEVIQSTITMQGYGQRMNRKQVDLPGLLTYWSDRVEHLLRACVQDRGCLPEANSIDVPFREFMADDIAMVERIYTRAGLDLTEAARAELQTFMVAHPRGAEGRMVYDLEGDFGISAEALRERFNFYFERFPCAGQGSGETAQPLHL
jgi:hypothetical protein